MSTRLPIRAPAGIGRWVFAFLALASLAAAPVPSSPAWTRPTSPLHLIGPVWYVGTEGLASYLIRTSQGAILIDGTLAENVPAIERNLRAIGVPIRQVHLLLLTHAHFDHAAGLAGLQHDSRARLLVGEGDAAAVRTGVPPGEVDYPAVRFPPAHVTRAVRDGDRVSLGDVTLTALATPGHTPGCTSWMLHAAGHRIIFLCSLTVAGNKLIGGHRYPGIVADFRRTFERLDATDADVVLPAHPEIADVRRRAATGTLVAPGLLHQIVVKARTDFAAEYAKQETAH